MTRSSINRLKSLLEESPITWIDNNVYLKADIYQKEVQNLRLRINAALSYVDFLLYTFEENVKSVKSVNINKSSYVPYGPCKQIFDDVMRTIESLNTLKEGLDISAKDFNALEKYKIIRSPGGNFTSIVRLPNQDAPQK